MALRVAVLLCGLQMALGCGFCDNGMPQLHMPEMPDLSHVNMQAHAQMTQSMQHTAEQSMLQMQMEQMAKQREAEMQQMNAQVEAESARIRAEFGELAKEFTKMKHQYAFNIVGEFVKLCKCGEGMYSLEASMVFGSAMALNLTDPSMAATYDITKLSTDMPRSREELSRQFFGGLITTMCMSANEYLKFAIAVDAQLKLLNPVTPAPVPTGVPLS